MFVDTSIETRGRGARQLEELARRHPHAFTAALMVLAVLVTLGLLFAQSPPIVLYQGF